MEQFARIALIIGENNLNILKSKNVAVFGIGGVGSYVVEAIARAGIENISVIDNDVVSMSNINRQLIALHSTVGKPKVNVVKERILDINPNAVVKVFDVFATAENLDSILNTSFDYVVDAIDSVPSKIALIVKCKELGIPIISCMGTGNKLDPTKFKITDISKTSVCPLARKMRKELATRNIKDVKVLYSPEEPVCISNLKENVPRKCSFCSFSCRAFNCQRNYKRYAFKSEMNPKNWTFFGFNVIKAYLFSS